MSGKVAYVVENIGVFTEFANKISKYSGSDYIISSVSSEVKTTLHASATVVTICLTDSYESLIRTAGFVLKEYNILNNIEINSFAKCALQAAPTSMMQMFTQRPLLAATVTLTSLSYIKCLAGENNEYLPETIKMPEFIQGISYVESAASILSANSLFIGLGETIKFANKFEIQSIVDSALAGVSAVMDYNYAQKASDINSGYMQPTAKAIESAALATKDVTLTAASVVMDYNYAQVASDINTGYIKPTAEAIESAALATKDVTLAAASIVMDADYTEIANEIMNYDYAQAASDINTGHIQPTAEAIGSAVLATKSIVMDADYTEIANEIMNYDYAQAASDINTAYIQPTAEAIGSAVLATKSIVMDADYTEIANEIVNAASNINSGYIQPSVEAIESAIVTAMDMPGKALSFLQQYTNFSQTIDQNIDLAGDNIILAQV